MGWSCEHARETGGSQPIDQSIERQIVVVADDDPAVRSYLQAALDRAGLQTLAAADGREALSLVARDGVALLLLDLHMPVMDGLETLRRIRPENGSRTLPVILVTGSREETDHVRGLESGADDFLVKPVSVNELTARVRAHLRGRAALADELDQGREQRRQLAAFIEQIPRDAPLGRLAAILTDGLPRVLGVDGVAILHFAQTTVRTVASSDLLRSTFVPAKALPKDAALQLARTAQTGPWLADVAGILDAAGASVDALYVPFRLGASAEPLGCLVYGQRKRSEAPPLSHRFADLVDSTEFVVAVLRPALERAETTDATIGRLRRIIARREFVTYVQPIRRLDTGETVAVEALTRFTDGVPPNIQFADAAHHGLGLAMERATLAGAIDSTASLPARYALSVNVSAEMLVRGPGIAKLIAGAGRPIILELTEHERIDDYPAVRSAFQRFGPDVKLAVDDAGSGFASLRHILALQPSYVKLDMEWVHGIDLDPVRRALVSGLAYFATETGATLVGEGIETETERQTLRDLGIPLGQGYLLGRPEPPVTG
jgi:EAL domain-containing protein (putative c-di-GMP-specific phosphodiesterase class I)/CheY-like chemotaxis protein